VKRRTTPPQAPRRPELTQPAADARSKLEARISDGKELLVGRLGDPLDPVAVRQLIADHKKWTKYNADLLRSLFSTEHYAEEYERCRPAPQTLFRAPTLADEVRKLHPAIGAELQCLDSVVDRLDLYASSAISGNAKSSSGAFASAHPTNGLRSPLDVLEQLTTRFHLVAQQLRSRHGGRNTIEVTDEYDVQDLLHALLLLEFDDVRPEEHTPSYAGGSARMDFLLKNEQAAVSGGSLGVGRRSRCRRAAC
jgi:hypothetical protein